MIQHIHLKINIISLLVAGIWPLQLKGPLKFLNKVHNIYSYFILTYFVLFEVTQYYQVSKIYDKDVYELSINLSQTLTYSLAIAKLTVCKSKSIVNLMHQIEINEKKILNGKNAQIKQIYLKNVNLNYFVNKLVLIIAYITVTTFYLNPVVKELLHPPKNVYSYVDNSTIVYTPRPLPFSSWFPFNKYKFYPVAYGIHIFTGIIGVTFIGSTDILFYGLMIYAVGQIKILQYCLENFKNFVKNKCDTEQKAFITDCVKHHLIIIK